MTNVQKQTIPLRRFICLAVLTSLLVLTAWATNPATPSVLVVSTVGAQQAGFDQESLESTLSTSKSSVGGLAEDARLNEVLKTGRLVFDWAKGLVYLYDAQGNLVHVNRPDLD
jgi:hypothetical protein